MMSAVLSLARAEPLRLPPTRAMPRRLIIHWRPLNVTAIAFASSLSPRIVAHSDAKHSDCRLCRSAETGEIAISIGTAVFPLTDGEALLVRAMFCPLGLVDESIP